MWLASLRSDLIFGWRQFLKHHVANASAILSLALAMGAITGVFRLVEAMLLRPLPVKSPKSLYYIETREYDPETRQPLILDTFPYVRFVEFKALLQNDADLLLISPSWQGDVTFGGDDEAEKFYRQFVSGNVFTVFGLKPALGRMILPSDDVTPGGHPIAVLSYYYWMRRFGGDAGVVGKTFRHADTIYEVVGVAPEGFVGTEPGVITDVFFPSMNADGVRSPGWSSFYIWIRPKPGVALETMKPKLDNLIVRDREEQVKSWIVGSPQEYIDAFLSARARFSPASNGTSNLKDKYRKPLLIVSVLATLVLLIACANIANLRAAQATAREREIALRISIGARRGRILQMILTESAMTAVLAALIGLFFAWFSVPWVVSMLTPPDEPVRLVLETDWQIVAFVAAATLVITFLFGLAPAIRASSIRPLHALKGGFAVRSNRRMMNSMLAAQVSFCVLVLFVGGLFVMTFNRLTNHRLGFSPENVLVVTAMSSTGAQPPRIWAEVADRMRQALGVQSVALANWALMSGNRAAIDFRKDGEIAKGVFLALDVSSNFFETMRIGWISGRDFRPDDRPLRPFERDRNGKFMGTVVIANEAFARYFFDGQNPVGRSVEMAAGSATFVPLEIVGYVRDAGYRNLRDPIVPMLYFPMGTRAFSTFLIRTNGESLAVADLLRAEIARARPDFRVLNMTTQNALIRRHTVTERLLAALSIFFAVTALVLAGMGLYSVLSYSVARRRQEIGIRRALGAQSFDVISRLCRDCAGPICCGALIGMVSGLACERYARALLFEVKGTDAQVLLLPALLLVCVALIAAYQPTVKALRVDPAETLREE